MPDSLYIILEYTLEQCTYTQFVPEDYHDPSTQALFFLLLQAQTTV